MFTTPCIKVKTMIRVKGSNILWLQADDGILRFRWALQQANMTSGVVAVAVQLGQIVLTLRSKPEDGREDHQEPVCHDLPKINELLELLHLALDDVVVHRTRVAFALDVAAADPVLLVIITSPLFVND
jgi:hypothetical protein